MAPDVDSFLLLMGLVKPFLLLFIFLFSVSGNADPLKEASLSELQRESQGWKMRLGLIETLEHLDKGIPPAKDQRVIEVAYDRYFRAASEIFEKTPGPRSFPLETCQEFFKVLRKGVSVQGYSVVDALRAKTTEEKKIARASLETLLYGDTLLLANLQRDADGGEQKSALKLSSEVRIPCEFEGRKKWKIAYEEYVMAFQKLNITLFGTRGLNNSFSLTSFLADLTSRQLTHEIHWYIPELVAETALFTAGISAITGFSAAKALIAKKGIAAVFGGLIGAQIGGAWSQEDVSLKSTRDQELNAAKTIFSINHRSAKDLFFLFKEKPKKDNEEIAEGTGRLNLIFLKVRKKLDQIEKHFTEWEKTDLNPSLIEVIELQTYEALQKIQANKEAILEKIRDKYGDMESAKLKMRKNLSLVSEEIRRRERGIP